MPALAGGALWCVIGAEYHGFIVKRKHIPGTEQRHASTNKSWPRKLRGRKVPVAGDEARKKGDPSTKNSKEMRVSCGSQSFLKCGSFAIC